MEERFAFQLYIVALRNHGCLDRYKTSLFFQEMSRKNVLAALEIIKRKQYQAWNKASDDEKVAFKIIYYVNLCYYQPKIELSAFKIAEVGIDNCKPLMKLQGVTRGTWLLFNRIYYIFICQSKA